VRTSLLLCVAAVSAFGQTVQPPLQFGNNPNQISVSPAWLYLNKIHYAGTWSTTYSYNAQDLVFYSDAAYISLQTSNLNHNPATSLGFWVVMPSTGSGGGGSGAAAWGNITGLLSNQTDLASALFLKEPTIAGGTTSQFWRGDKTWQLPPVVSFNARTGAIVPATGDYNTNQVTEGANAYFTTSRAITAVLPALSASVPLAYNATTGVFSCPTCGSAVPWGALTGTLTERALKAAAARPVK